jgi:ubiquinone biosynthesis protein
MNALSFLDLMHMIFTQKQPNLAKIERKGLLAVKIAQTFALRVDFLPEETCQHLAKLYTQTTRLEREDVMGLLKRYTDPTWMDHFSVIEPEPIGSASVGQVHKGQLKDGTWVAIKVIKHDFAQAFERDVHKLTRLMRFAIWVYPKLAKVADPIGIIEYIREYTLAELDLRNEIKHGKILRDIHQAHQASYDLSRLAFPTIYEALSNEKVMVSEYIEGPTVDALLEARALSPSDILEIFKLHGFYMYATGTFHGDLHPGNILYKNNTYYFIDTGAIAHVGVKIRRGLFEFMAHLSKSDFEGCAHALNDMAERGIEGARFERFVEDMLVLYKDFHGKSVQEISLTKKMMQTIKLGVESGMEFEKGMFSIIKSHMYLDGIVLKGNPEAVLMKDVGQFIDVFRAEGLIHA